LLVGEFLVSDVGSDHFLIPTNGRDKVSARPEFVAEKHLAFDILCDPDRTLPFRVADDLHWLTLVPATRGAQRLLVKDVKESAERIRAGADALLVELEDAGITHAILKAVRGIIETRASHLIRITEKA
jgi:hypothetical protein